MALRARLLAYVGSPRCRSPFVAARAPFVGDSVPVVRDRLPGQGADEEAVERQAEFRVTLPDSRPGLTRDGHRCLVESEGGRHEVGTPDFTVAEARAEAGGHLRRR